MEKVNAANLDWETTAEGETQFRRKRLAAASGADELGCSLYELDPGDRSWPYHYHTANEEAIYVLAGSGALRWDDETVPLEAGDYVPLLPDASGAHRVTNDGEDVLRYLMVSTMREPEVLVYPDSDKVGVMAASPPGATGERTVEGYFRRADAVEYWDGED